ncbi:hypothetical protein [Psychroflexus aestuariivivens]|uniref:hypothetical protein n=1 Tax=Psychroflexus aestuariivivens TaxID=1795040 RepID=UPI000FDAA998|nr:hypothetical protein [Psychroflexus aestuariivivens]
MEHNKATKLIKKIIEELETSKFITETVVEDLKELRPYAVEEELPVVAKTLRLVYEHIDENEVFAIPIPQDEPISEEEDELEESESEETENTELITGAESLIYLINLIRNPENPINKAEIREYNRKMEAFAE